MQFFDLLFILLCVVSFHFFFTKLRKSNGQTKQLPPGPRKAPFIGNMLHMLSGLPHHVLRDLATKYGQIMHLQLGEVSTVVVTSPEMAEQVLKTHDLAFASRPKFLIADIVMYNSSDIAFSPYGDYWRQMRKICVAEVLSAKNVRSFSSIRQDEVSRLIEFLRSSSSDDDDDDATPVNITERIFLLTSSMTCRSTFGKTMKEQDVVCIQLLKKMADLINGFNVVELFPSLKFLHVLCGTKGKIMDIHHNLDAIVENIINEHKRNLETGKTHGESGGEDLIDVLLRLKKEGDLQFPITNDNIKAIILDMFAAGTETSTTTINWAMVEIMRNPIVLARAQAEVRKTFRDKESFGENDVEELKYLKLAIKETLRLHPPFPLLVPRECREETEINGYTIPLKTKVMVNVWAIGRDPKYWDDAESFKPERFENNPINFGGKNFEFLPFGSGRRICPGIAFGLANIYFPLAQLLYHFDWKLPTGVYPNDLDLTELGGATTCRKSDLHLIFTPYRRTLK